MRCNIWHLYSVNVIVSADHMIETMLPVHCHKWHSIIIVKQESAISIYGFPPLSLLPTRWSHSRLELFQTLKPTPQKLTRPRYLPANPNPYWPASPISWVTSMAFCSLAVCPLTPVSNYRQNVVFHQYGYLYWYFPSAPTLSPGLWTLLLESRLVCPLLPLPLASPPQLWMVQQIFFKCNTKNQLAFSVVCQEIHSILIFQ